MTLATKTYKDYMAKRKKTGKEVTSGVACPELCQFPRCLKTCHHEMADNHDEHFCSDHCGKKKFFTLQPRVPLTVGSPHAKKDSRAESW